VKNMSIDVNWSDFWCEILTLKWINVKRTDTRNLCEYIVTSKCTYIYINSHFDVRNMWRYVKVCEPDLQMKGIVKSIQVYSHIIHTINLWT
jgi:hypothetical protein